MTLESAVYVTLYILSGFLALLTLFTIILLFCCFPVAGFLRALQVEVYEHARKWLNALPHITRVRKTD